MRILITNDDGILAPGLAVLEEIARQISDDVWTIAPDSDQSGIARALTLSEPLRLRQLDKRRYCVSGTPTDCVIMAVQHVLKEAPPDVVLSGINRGQNIAEDVLYSGTVAGAMEGAAFGVPAIALSQAYTSKTRDTLDYAIAQRHAKTIIDALLAAGRDRGTLVNINFPACQPDAVKGIRITRQGYRDQLLLDVIERRDGRDFSYYWLAFQGHAHRRAEGTDLQAIDEHYISVTPLKLDMTDYDALSRVRDALPGARDTGARG